MTERNNTYSIKAKIEEIPQCIRIALRRILEDAQTQRDLAGVAGIIGDGGASEMEMQVTAFVDGWLQSVPEWLQDYITQLDYEADSEFTEYHRLHTKFNGYAPREKKRDFTVTIPHWSDKKGKTINEDIMKDFR